MMMMMLVSGGEMERDPISVSIYFYAESNDLYKPFAF
jgi:hypothetical protein